ncbi:MAG: elongation factor P [Chloroflexi bacterium RBG_13_54_9]|nr:MAG: elongation factor P [Chloroflexi bacterium RBG_13_54_9]
MIDTGDLKKGLTIELEGQLYHILDYQHIKMGRGSAQIRLKLRDLRAGHTIERTFQAGEKFLRARVDRHNVQFLYQDGDLYYFMDTESFEQNPLTKIQLGDAVNYLKEGLTLELLTYGNEAIGVELPNSVDLKVVETGPAFKGDTAQSGTKPAVLETGITIQVPLFVSVGDTVRVDTRTGNYLERVA